MQSRSIRIRRLASRRGTVRRRTRPVIRLRRKAPAIKSLARKVAINTKNIMTWKSYHEESDSNVLDLFGNISTTAPNGVRALMFQPSLVRSYYEDSTIPQRRDITQARKTNNPFIDRMLFQVAVRNTHNHAVAIRFLCFQNTGWLESLQFAYSVQPRLSSLSNIYTEYTTKVDRPYIADALDVQNQKFNKALCERTQDKLLDKTFYMRPFQGVATGGADTSTQSLRTYRFNVPVKKRWSYEARQTADAENDEIKSGNVFFVMLVGPADPTNTSNNGQMTIDYRSAVIYKENV